MNKRGKNCGIGWREGGYEEKRKEGRKDWSTQNTL
jgi:hypothetical protein